MFTRLSPNVQAILLAFFGYAAFSVADTAAKLLTQTYHPFQVVGLNAIAVTLVCILVARPLGGMKKTLQTKQLKTHILRGFFNTALLVLIVFGLSKLNLPEFYTIIFCTPFITTLMARVFFKEHISPYGLMAIIVGFCGVLTIMRPGTGVFDPWLLLPLAATIFISCFSLLAKKFGNDETIISFGFYSAITNFTLVSIPVLFLFDLPSAKHIPLFLTVGFAGTAGLILNALAFRKAKAILIAPIQYTQMLWGILFGILIFNKSPDLWTLAGAAIIIIGGILLLHSDKKAA